MPILPILRSVQYAVVVLVIKIDSDGTYQIISKILIYIDDLTCASSLFSLLFADDTTLSKSGQDMHAITLFCENPCKNKIHDLQLPTGT